VKACKLDAPTVRILSSPPHGAVSAAPPIGVFVDRWGPDLTITRSWQTPTLWFYGAGCVFWNVFIVVWFTIAISHLNSDTWSRGAWFPVVFAIPQTIAGVCLAYATICRFVNQTRIHVASNEISVWHEPLPWLGNCTLSPCQLKQLFSVERSHPKGPARVTYEVLAWQKDDEYVALLTGLEDVQQAHFIEREIETFLALTKECVPPGFMVKS